MEKLFKEMQTKLKAMENEAAGVVEKMKKVNKMEEEELVEEQEREEREAPSCPVISELHSSLPTLCFNLFSSPLYFEPFYRSVLTPWCPRHIHQCGSGPLFCRPVGQRYRCTNTQALVDSL